MAQASLSLHVLTLDFHISNQFRHRQGRLVAELITDHYVAYNIVVTWGNIVPTWMPL